MSAPPTPPDAATGPRRVYAPTLGEEIAHAVTHGLGAVLATVGFVVLLVAAVRAHGTPAYVVGCGVYGGSLVALYLASTIFHAVPAHKTRLKWLFQRGDHAAIYLLIAGTYTPIMLFAVQDPLAMWVLAAEWLLAAGGLFITGRSLLTPQTPASKKTYERQSLALYLAMGWLAILVIRPLIHALPMTPLVLLVAGGIAYTAGVAFFISPRKWAHSIWHGFVMAGSTLHFISIFLMV